MTIERYYGHDTGISPEDTVVDRTNFQSSWAVDKDSVDQDIEGTEATKLTCERVLWDLGEDCNLEDASFAPPVDGLWLWDGTITLTNTLNVRQVFVEIWRDGALWFTVASGSPDVVDSKVSLSFSCMADCYASESHVFDLRVRLTGTSPTARVSGSAEDTAWGATFQHFLNGVSPT